MLLELVTNHFLNSAVSYALVEVDIVKNVSSYSYLFTYSVTMMFCFNAIWFDHGDRVY